MTEPKTFDLGGIEHINCRFTRALAKLLGDADCTADEAKRTDTTMALMGLLCISLHNTYAEEVPIPGSDDDVYALATYEVTSACTGVLLTTFMAKYPHKMKSLHDMYHDIEAQVLTGYTVLKLGGR